LSAKAGAFTSSICGRIASAIDVLGCDDGLANQVVSHKTSELVMPYISKKEREEACWSGLTEAIEQIQTVDRLKPEQALKLLATAIEDRGVRARKNGDNFSPADFRGRVLICLDWPGSIYIDRLSPESLEIVPGPVNDSEDLDADDYKTVSLLRKDVNKHWPRDGGPGAKREGRVSGAKLARPRKVPKGLAKNYSESDADKALTEINDAAKASGAHAPNKTQAQTLMSRKGFPRSVVKRLLKMPKHAQCRRKTGKPKK
jgi:hypothetical protein